MKMVILDRDGVLNHDREDFIKTPDEWEPIDGSMEAVARLNEAGYRVMIATNQSGIGRGMLDMATFNRINLKMHSILRHFGGWIDAIFFCPDPPDSDSQCRKPNPGMLHEIREHCNTTLEDTPMVGDKLSDIQAAIAGGAQPVLVRTGYGAQTEKSGKLPDGVPVYDDLRAFVEHLLEKPA